MSDINSILERFNRFNMKGIEPDRGEGVQTYAWPVNGTYPLKVLDIIFEESSKDRPIYIFKKELQIEATNVQFLYELTKDAISFDDGTKLPAGSKFYGERFKYAVDENDPKLTDGHKKNIEITKRRMGGVIRTLLNRNPGDKLGLDLGAIVSRIKGGNPVIAMIKTVSSREGEYTNHNEYWQELLST